MGELLALIFLIALYGLIIAVSIITIIFFRDFRKWVLEFRQEQLNQRIMLNQIVNLLSNISKKNG